MRIYAAHDSGGCGYYRLIVPLTELAKHDEFDVTIPEPHAPAFENFNSADYDVVIGQRFANYLGMKWWRQGRTGTNRLVYDIDDDVFSVTPDNAVPYAAYSKLDERAGVAGFMTYSDTVTVTNDHLADVMSQHSVNVQVLPNCIQRFVLDLPQHKGGPDTGRRLKLGYMGSGSHGADVPLAAPHVSRFIDRNPDWDLVLSGYDYRSSFKVPADRMKLTPWVNVCDDPENFYSALDFDIGICPLRDTKFNRSKSYIKALEYNARGIPVIASAVGPYKDYIRDGWNGFLVKQPHEWSKYLNLLANDHELRSLMSTRSHVVANYHTIETGNWQKWADAYRGLWK